MNLYYITNVRSGIFVGGYVSKTVAGAIDAACREAGYADRADAGAALGFDPAADWRVRESKGMLPANVASPYAVEGLIADEQRGIESHRRKIADRRAGSWTPTLADLLMTNDEAILDLEQQIRDHEEAIARLRQFIDETF